MSSTPQPWTTAHVGGLVVDLAAPLDLSIPVAFDPIVPGDGHSPSTPRAFFIANATTEPVVGGAFVGDVRRGGSCNCFTHHLTPHGNGTHTEGVGHVVAEQTPVVTLVDGILWPALVVTVDPQPLGSTQDEVAGTQAASDLVVDELSLVDAIARSLALAPAAFVPTALVVRTAPGGLRRAQAFSGTNPPYLTPDAMRAVCDRGIVHLLVDLPSVDREDDGGMLSAHRVFFGLLPQQTTLVAPAPRRSITELIAVDAHVADGAYALSLQLAPLLADAVPSRPLLFAVQAPAFAAVRTSP